MRQDRILLVSLLMPRSVSKEPRAIGGCAGAEPQHQRPDKQKAGDPAIPEAGPYHDAYPPNKVSRTPASLPETGPDGRDSLLSSRPAKTNRASLRFRS